MRADSSPWRRARIYRRLLRLARRILRARPSLRPQSRAARSRHRLTRSEVSGCTASTVACKADFCGSDCVEQFRVGVEPGGDRLDGLGNGMVNGFGVE